MGNLYQFIDGAEDSMRPVVYQGQKVDGYFVDNTLKENSFGDMMPAIYSEKTNKYLKPVSKKNEGRGDYPAVSLMMNHLPRRANGTIPAQIVPIHIIIMESAGPDIPPPFGVTQEEYDSCPESVKKYLRRNRNGYNVDHINENKYDYRLENLRWLTPKQNTQAWADNKRISKDV